MNLTRNMVEYEMILNKPCLICKELNRFHRVFWSPYTLGYQTQQIEIKPDELLVIVTDHYACLGNLEYLEHLNERRSNI